MVGILVEAEEDVEEGIPVGGGLARPAGVGDNLGTEVPGLFVAELETGGSPEAVKPTSIEGDLSELGGDENDADVGRVGVEGATLETPGEVNCVLERLGVGIRPISMLSLRDLFVFTLDDPVDDEPVSLIFFA